MTAKPKVRHCGPFVRDPDVPPDHNGKGVCASCHLPGRPGDAHHTLPPAPPVDVQQLRAGENGDE